MAKKKQRQPNLPQETLDRATARATRRPVERPRPDVAAPPSPKPESPAPAARGAPAVDLAREYRYVVEDLQRIGVLAALMLIALVALKILAG